jgi:peptidoglycan hydrolase-like protein with peptidoglycan-binding domain
MKKIASFVFGITIATASLHADLQVRAVQQQLKEQGFYYGEVDGSPGGETGAAIRRYQIRNGLQVTGTLTQETLEAMKIGGSAAPTATPKAKPVAHTTTAKPKPTPVQSASESDREFLRQQSGGLEKPVPQPNKITLPAPVAIPSQPSDLSSQYASLFARTPYENAPLEVQQRTLRDAQLRLFREQFYTGAVDGIPGAATARAITFYQNDADLPRTGRLDLETLREMRLLPARRITPIIPFFSRPDYDPPAEQPRVYRGIWVR